jgi:hypothetical protein
MRHRRHHKRERAGGRGILTRSRGREGKRAGRNEQCRAHYWALRRAALRCAGPRSRRLLCRQPDHATRGGGSTKAIVRTPAAGRARLGDSSSQVDRPPGGPGPRSCVGTRLATTIGAPLFVSRGEALRYVRRFASAASGCRNRTNLAVGLHRRTALPSTTSASGRRRSSRFISPQLRVSS